MQLVFVIVFCLAGLTLLFFVGQWANKTNVPPEEDPRRRMRDPRRNRRGDRF